jgi:hypothetical protein
VQDTARCVLFRLANQSVYDAFGETEVKVKSLCLTKHHAMKTYWESGCIVPRILDIGTRLEVSGQLHALAALPPGKESPVSIG